MGYIFILTAAVLLIEFITMTMSYDDFFDNIGWSLIWGMLVTAIIFGIAQVEVEKTPSEQEVMLMEQDKWAEDIITDVIGIDYQQEQEIQAETSAKIKQLFDELTPNEEYVSVEPRARRHVPSTSSYINESRRNYDVSVTYDHDSRLACDIDDTCFRANTIQHTDGSFWACKRNYGTCYQY